MPTKFKRLSAFTCLTQQAMKKLWNIMNGTCLWFGLVLMLGLLSGGCYTPKANHVFSPLPEDGINDVGSDDATYRFVVGDLITVRFAGAINQTPTHEERIKEDGTVTLPWIGSVKAAGKTSVELHNEIYHLYVPRYYTNLTIPPPGEQRVYYVGGQVCSPGRQVYVGETTVSKAIESAGGFADYASRPGVQLTRTDGKSFVINFVRAVEDASLDLPVYPGDKAFVPTRSWRDFFR